MKKLRIGLLLLTVLMCLCACAGKDRSLLTDGELLAVGDTICRKADAEIFILSQRSMYTKGYGEAIWNVQLENGSFESYVKEALLDYLEELYLVDAAAVADGIVLSEAETAAVHKAADAFMTALGQEAADTLGIGSEQAEAAYTRFLRAQIYYRTVMNRSMEEISDEEARAASVQIISLSQENGISVAQEVLALLKDGSTFADIQKELKPELFSSRTETVIRGTYNSIFDAMVFSLRKGEYSPIIMADKNYLIVRCLAPYVADATAKNKAEMELAARDNLLQEALGSFAGKLRLRVNPRLWESVAMSDYAAMPPVSFYDYTDLLNYKR